MARPLGWRGALIFVHERAAADPGGCSELLTELAALHQAHADEPVLRQRWAMSVMTFIYRRAAEDPGGCSELLSELTALHQAHADEPELRVQWAGSVDNYTSHRAAEDPERCWDLLTDLAALHQAHPGEPGLREGWARSVTNFIRHRAVADPERCSNPAEGFDDAAPSARGRACGGRGGGDNRQNAGHLVRPVIRHCGKPPQTAALETEICGLRLWARRAEKSPLNPSIRQ